MKRKNSIQESFSIQNKILGDLTMENTKIFAFEYTEVDNKSITFTHQDFNALYRVRKMYKELSRSNPVRRSPFNFGDTDILFSVVGDIEVFESMEDFKSEMERRKIK